MASQRHKMLIMNYGAQCTASSEKQPAAGYMRQLPGPFTVPIGPAGGPLKGSSLAGPAPTLLPGPSMEQIIKLGLILAAGQIPPDVGAPAAARTFPIGPLPLLRVEPDPEGAWYVLFANGQLAEGDDVTVEATGSSVTNGNFTAGQVTTDGHEMKFFVPGIELAAPIMAKGRVIITDGAI